MSDEQWSAGTRSKGAFGRFRAVASPSAFALTLLLAWLCSSVHAPGAESFSEADVRAVFLLNFASFVDWPETAFDTPSTPYRYCALGSRVLADSLAKVLADERVDGRALRLDTAEQPADWRRCHVLYLDGSAAVGAARVLGAVRGAPVLTVGDSLAFARSGGMIGLVRKGGRLRPVINRDAAEREGIRISSKLLRLATIVSEAGG